MKNCILSCIFSKATHRSDSEKGENKKDVAAAVGKDVDVGVGVDVWSEILLNVDPYWIFKCILVSKECLQVITSCCFRRKYLKKWKGCFPVIGFMHGERNLQLVTANKLCSHIEKMKLMRGTCRFISKSSSGDGLILCIDDDKNSMHVFNPAGSGGVLWLPPLPPPPASLRSQDPTVIISTNASFKVIIVAWSSVELTSMSIQTFCSSRWAWERWELSCCDSFCLAIAPAIGSSKGVVYWPCQRNRMVEYDTNNQHIRLISGPVEDYSYCLSIYDIVSPGGNLQCATVDRDGIIHIRELSEGRDKSEWKALYTVDTAYVCWQMNLRETGKNDLSFGRLFDSYFVFVSFVPGRSDSIFLARGCRLFIYNARTQQLDEFQVPVPRANIRRIANNYKLFVPLTAAESGVWPSSPPSTHGISPGLVSTLNT